MINENTYERIVSNIRDAAERVTLRLIALQATFARRIAKDPNAYSQYRQAFNRDRQKALDRWRLDIQGFLNDDLPEAYVLGTKDTDAHVKRIGVTNDPDRPIPNRQIMAAGIHGTGYTSPGIREMFAKAGITKH